MFERRHNNRDFKLLYEIFVFISNKIMSLERNIEFENYVTSAGSQEVSQRNRSDQAKPAILFSFAANDNKAAKGNG